MIGQVLHTWEVRLPASPIPAFRKLRLSCQVILPERPLPWAAMHFCLHVLRGGDLTLRDSTEDTVA